MKKLIMTLCIAISFASFSFALTKEADLAGSWYPSSNIALKSMLEGYLSKAKVNAPDGEILGLISPHAAYQYSGGVAAYGYSIVRNKDIKTVIVIGFNHKFYHKGIAISDFDFYRTPLGDLRIDHQLAAELIGQDRNTYSLMQAFKDENSIEMQIPFIQEVLPDAKAVLISMGDESLENCKILSEALYKVLAKRDKYLLIASTDLSHFLVYDQAVSVDGFTVSKIEEFNPENLYKESALKNHTLMCGYGAVVATMMACKKLGADKIEVLKYENSGDIAFNKSSVVGYASAAIVKSEIRNPKSEINPKSETQNMKQGEEKMLNGTQKEKLLKLARDSISLYLAEGGVLEVKESDPVLNQKMGAFVTLHERGELRGCIGNIVGQKPLYLTVRDMAIEAATGDPRFRPVTLDEMGDIDIEISALSPLEKISDPNIIEMGKDGVLVKKGFRSGVYLPQVATETGWSRDEFMNSLCGQKAGIEPDAWKRGLCEIYIFTAEVFSEK